MKKSLLVGLVIVIIIISIVFGIKFVNDSRYVCVTIEETCCKENNCQSINDDCREGSIKTFLGCDQDCKPIKDCIYTEPETEQTEEPIQYECKQFRFECCQGDICNKIENFSCDWDMLEIIKECNPDGCIPIPDCEFDEFMFKDIPYPQDDPNYVAAQPDPDYDFFTWTLPTGASDLRLSLMADIDDFLFDEYGGIGGWGKHDGEHTEGLGHTWIELKSGTPVKSLADGKVKSVQLSGTEYHITIHYGHGLVGGHGEIMTPYVETGDVVKRGQEIGIGMSFQSGQSSAEYSLTDLNRTDGSRSRYGGSGVSVFDYLEEEDKKLIVNKYKEEVIESFLRDGTTVWGFNPVEPYLTNKLFHHDDNPGTILGTWYLISEPWGTEYPSDIMAFIEADNPFYTGTLANSQDDQGDGDWNFEGEYEVDYSVTPNKLKIIQPVSTDFYAIFEVIEDNGASYGFEPERATMKIQFSEVNYPSTFSDDAYVYIQRTQYPRREDGIEPAPGG